MLLIRHGIQKGLLCLDPSGKCRCGAGMKRARHGVTFASVLKFIRQLLS